MKIFEKGKLLIESPPIVYSVGGKGIERIGF